MSRKLWKWTRGREGKELQQSESEVANVEDEEVGCCCYNGGRSGKAKVKKTKTKTGLETEVANRKERGSGHYVEEKEPG